jgi:C_GCAxxG_C_C family probable redox protein
MTDPIQRATERFEQGFSCSQSVFSAFAPQLDLSDEVAFKIASPFGGGIARQGETCGAVTGALMALGLKYGPGSGGSNDKMYEISQEFLQKFKEAHASTQCKQLIQFDLSQPPDLQAARQSQVFKSICPKLVETAAGIVQSMLSSKP